MVERSPIPPRLPWNPSFLKLQRHEVEFAKRLTGITGDEELNKHIIEVGAKAYESFSYPCIRAFEFVRLPVCESLAYLPLLELGQSRPGAILLEVACGFGGCIRKLVDDGWPVENVIASDLEPGLWQYGHELFKSTPQSFPASFVPGDAFNPSMIKPREEPFYTQPITPRLQNLQELKSLTPLQGHVSAIHTGLFFHLFDDTKQIQLARLLASLLSPEPGSIICGYQRGAGVKMTTRNFADWEMVLHSPESWKELWDGGIFRKGTVRVDVVLKDMSKGGLILSDGGTYDHLDWCVTRLPIEEL